MKDLIDKHAALIDEHVRVTQEEQDLLDTLISVQRRIDELEADPKASETDLFKARDKLRHTHERRSKLYQQRLGIEGELAKVKFQADLT